ncbi:ABC transporter, permease protein [Shuttleworthella sp. MSX8B]|uniref:carbohydrate ABC transporter permease n=1 Tax=Shuttleworthella sp. MSX8B TaxID=936574 RepID=UPI00044FFFAD|nr:carbohydrate ABC transporter permease [Shuttleworthia sp. MSX8B]EUB15852.1 ABC transporter, permease protein [Shuttleworthia sp. MSX8B]
MRNSKKYTVISEILCLFFLLLFVYPLVLMIGKAFDNGGIGNFVRVFRFFDLWKNLRTSILTVGGTLLIVGFCTSLAAFSFSKLRFRGKNILYYVFLTGLMIPASSLIFPLYQIVRLFHFNNTPLALIFPYAALNCCFNLLILKNYYDTLPSELMDAGRIDGANTWQIFCLVMQPIARPGLVFVLIQTFLSAWNELQMGMIFITDNDIQPLSVIPLRFLETRSPGFTSNVLYAALVICLVPIGIFYVFASRKLVSGLSAGAVKG